MFEIATSNTDAVSRLRKRLHDDVGFFLGQCNEHHKASFWALTRTMFPVAESLAYLLYGDDPPGTSTKLSKFIRDELGAKNPNYQTLASVICQVWRHGLTHGDEPPFLIVGAVSDGAGGRNFSAARAMSWKLVLRRQAEHLTVNALNTQTAQFTFCLTTFYSDLKAVTLDATRWAQCKPDEVKDRYNHWCSKFLDDLGATTEARAAADEIRAILS